MVFPIALLVIIIYFRFTTLKRLKIDKDKFKLYNFRDRLVWLVAKGKLSQDSLVFKIMYDGINNGITVMGKNGIFLKPSDRYEIDNISESDEDIKQELKEAVEEVRAWRRGELKLRSLDELLADGRLFDEEG